MHAWVQALRNAGMRCVVGLGWVGMEIMGTKKCKRATGRVCGHVTGLHVFPTLVFDSGRLPKIHILHGPVLTRHTAHDADIAATYSQEAL